MREPSPSAQWDKNPPALQLPTEILQKTREKYLEAYERLAGRPVSSTLSEKWTKGRG